MKTQAWLDKKIITKKLIKFFSYYYPVLIVILFFILKSHLFNYWVGFSLTFWKTRTMTSLGLITILLLPTIFLNRKNIFRYSLFISIITSLIFTTYFIYNNYAGGILSLSAIGYAGQLLSVTDIIVKLITLKSLTFSADIIILLALYLFFRKKENRRTEIRNSYKVALTLILLLLGSILYSSAFIKEKSLKHLFIPIDSLAVVQKNGIVNYASQDLFRFFTKKKKATEEEKNLIKEWSKNQTPYDGKNLEGIAKGKNIIFIQLESYQDFLIDLKLDGQELTPNLNSLAKENYRFNNFYFQTGPGNTSDAEFSILNSLYPLIDQSVNFDYPDNNYNSMISMLENNSYTTSIMHGYRKDFWNREMIYNNYGIDKFYDSTNYEIKDRVGWGVSDEDFYKKSIEYLKEQREPFFSMLVTLSNHSPYIMPEDKKMLDIKDGRFDELISNYLQGAKYTDKALGQVIEMLKKEGLYQNSIIIIYGDHTAGIKEFANEEFKDLIKQNDFMNNYDLIYERVPFVIHFPDNKKGVNNDPKSFLDVYPTIANFLGLKTPKTALGQDMFNYQDSYAFLKRNSLMNKSLIYNDFLYLYPQSEVYEESICYNWREKKETSLNKCLPYIEKMEKVFRINDLIIQTNNLNLIK